MRAIGLVLAPLAAASLAASCGGQDSPSVPRSAIAVVGDRTIARSQFDTLMAQARQSYASQGRAFPAAGTQAYSQLKRLVVSLLVEQAELEQRAPALGVQIDEPQVAVGLQRLKEESFGGSEQRYRKRLRAAGMTEAQVRSAVRAQLLADAVRQAVTAGVTVPIEAVKQYYERNLDDYTAPRSRVVRHILVHTRAAAEQVVTRLRAGVAFAAVAKRSSVDVRTRAEGGLLTLVEGRTAPGLDRVAFALDVGRTSRPFETAFGWELVRAVSPIRPGRTRPFAAVRDGIRRHLLRQRRTQTFERWLAKTRAEFAAKTTFAEGFAPTELP
jgi:parvulin-like peptidyl-prolyl isomerase